MSYFNKLFGTVVTNIIKKTIDYLIVVPYLIV
jgi:hypothetical protein